jgi:hypothetical protein
MALSPVADVRVIEPREERTALHKFVTYRIIALCPEGHPVAGCHDVRRRYSDFDLLSQTLIVRYVGMVIPPLPPKRGNLFSSSSASTPERLRGLALFAERLVRTPTLLLDSLASAFFGLPTADPWEAAVRRADATRFERANNPGLLRWHGLLEKVTLPDDAEVERLAASVVRELGAAETALGAVEKAAEAACITAIAHAEAMASLATAATEWARIEDADVKCLNTLTDGGASSSGGAAARARSPTREQEGGAAGGASFAAAGGYSPHSSLLRGFGGFAMLESRVQAAQPALIEVVLLETVHTHAARAHAQTARSLHARWRTHRAAMVSPRHRPPRHRPPRHRPPRHRPPPPS